MSVDTLAVKPNELIGRPASQSTISTNEPAKTRTATVSFSRIRHLLSQRPLRRPARNLTQARAAEDQADIAAAQHALNEAGSAIDYGTLRRALGLE